MVRVFFDHQKFSTQRYGGISRYFANIIDEIGRTNDFEFLLGVLYSNNHYIEKGGRGIYSTIAKRLLQSEYGTRTSKLNEFYCKHLLKQNHFDIFHPTYYDTYFFDKLKKPMVTTIHDMTHERLPEYFWAKNALTHNKRLNIERADKIIAISETTKKDILQLTDVKEEKIEVIYHGIDLHSPLVYKEIDQLPSQYILFVGDRSGYKNFYVFIDAFEHICSRFPDLHLILCGGGDLGIADVEILTRKNLLNKVRHVHVSDEELNFLYSNAVVFVYPSLYEGFGLPILEAYKAQCPLLLSDIECFKEIAGDAAIYFRKHDKGDLIEKITFFIENSGVREDLVARGNERIKLYPIEVSNRKTLELYRKLT